MRYLLTLVLTMAGASRALAADEPKPAHPLRVLYVGNVDTDRGRSYARFLAEHFTLMGSADRKTFDPNSAATADVVVLDWSQSDIQHPEGVDIAHSESKLKSPLGDRGRWDRPTVLLGSAGHLMAAPWKVFGGSG